MGLIREIFTWWNGQTIGTRLYTSRNGQRVGEDEQGNIYYRTGDNKRRWVIYNGEAEASRVSPDWHAWMHHTVDEPPTERPLPRKAWEKDHVPNQTGTGQSWVPPGSILTAEARARTTGDYEAWKPE